MMIEFGSVLPWHSLVSQTLRWLSCKPLKPFAFDNKQYNPPCSDDGLLHERVLCWLPPPQVTSHSVKSLQAPQFPLTRKKQNKCFLEMSNWTSMVCKNGYNGSHYVWSHHLNHFWPFLTYSSQYSKVISRIHIEKAFPVSLILVHIPNLFKNIHGDILYSFHVSFTFPNLYG